MKVLSLLSGGMDSATLLYFLKDEGHELTALSIDYGQRHRDAELDAAAAIAERAAVEILRIDISSVGRLFDESALTGDIDVPEGHYADENMKVTVVPDRNLIFLAIAAGVAVARRLDAIGYAAHRGDHTIYPDCRPEFADAAEKAIQLGNWHQLQLLRPFIDKTKTDIVTLGAPLGVPHDITWSCYQGRRGRHCGKCGTCVERKEAFAEAGIADPTEYEVASSPLAQEPRATER